MVAPLPSISLLSPFLMEPQDMISDHSVPPSKDEAVPTSRDTDAAQSKPTLGDILPLSTTQAETTSGSERVPASEDNFATDSK
ncbi:MAG: hypothetical protein Q9176_001706 [Flavoplaca citrina]